LTERLLHSHWGMKPGDYPAVAAILQRSWGTRCAVGSCLGAAAAEKQLPKGR
jgi:hypothetical protein